MVKVEKYKFWHGLFLSSHFPASLSSDICWKEKLNLKALLSVKQLYDNIFVWRSTNHSPCQILWSKGLGWVWIQKVPRVLEHADGSITKLVNNKDKGFRCKHHSLILKEFFNSKSKVCRPSQDCLASPLFAWSWCSWENSQATQVVQHHLKKQIVQSAYNRGTPIFYS